VEAFYRRAVGRRPCRICSHQRRRSARVAPHPPTTPPSLSSRRKHVGDPESGESALLSFLGDVAVIGIGLVGTWFISKELMKSADPTAAGKKKGQERGAWVRRKFPRVQNLELEDHELMIVNDVLDASEISVTLDSVGGLGDQKNALRRKVLHPLEHPEVFSTPLLGASRGILLWGPPGTGKTMLAQALARESRAAFINVRASSLQNKWFGETNKIVAALFSLARKLEPTIIFIDEVDALLGARGGNEQDFVTAYKTEFMSHWEGMTTDRSARVVVMAATNRPDALDDAVKRRFPDRFEVSLPDARGRLEILHKKLTEEAYARLRGNLGPKAFGALTADETLSGGGWVRLQPFCDPALLTEPERELAEVVRLTDRFSGSDMLQVAREAAREVATRPRPEGAAMPRLTRCHLEAEARLLRPATDEIGSSSRRDAGAGSGGFGSGGVSMPADVLSALSQAFLGLSPSGGGGRINAGPSLPPRRGAPPLSGQRVRIATDDGGFVEGVVVETV